MIKKKKSDYRGQTVQEDGDVKTRTDKKRLELRGVGWWERGPTED